MNGSHSFTLLGTPVTAIFSVLVVLAAVALAYIAWRRSGWHRGVGWLELIRVAIVSISALLFNQPEWIEEFFPEEKPSLAVLIDGSRSMQTQDAVRSGASPTTRAEAIKSLKDPATWGGVDRSLQVTFHEFSHLETDRGTNLHQPLLKSLEQSKNLRGIVLVSDGDWNSGEAPVQAATRLQLKGVPVFTVLAGSSTRLPDIELTSVDLPTFGVVGKTLRIPFTIESSLPREYATTVTMRTSDGETLTKDVRIAAMGRTSDSLSWKPATTGDFTVTVDVPRHADELLPDNNTETAPIAIRQEKLRVLVVESYPRWEYRFLRNALSRDPGVEVSCLLFHPGLTKPGGGNKDYIKQFPASIEELSKYDVVFLGDIGLDDGQLTEEQCRLLRGLVEHQASGLVFLPGLQGRQFDLLRTELADLLPVVLDPDQPGGWGSRNAGHFELTEMGRRSLLTKLADTPEENAQVWEDLPGFQWYAPVIRSKAGTEVLSVHGEMSNEHGRLPLLVTRTFGAGKVLFMGTDGAWRWRKGVEDKYHYRFWGQVVRWMAYQRNMAKGDSMRLYYAPDQPLIRQTIQFHVHAMEKSGEPLSQGEVLARIEAPSGRAEVVKLLSEGTDWGVFSGQYIPQEPGAHQVLLSCKQTGATLPASFFVQGSDLEPIGKPARPEVLEELARVTGGKSVDLNHVEEIVDLLNQLPPSAPSIRRMQLWSHPLIALALIALMGAFWIGRKMVGLI